MRVERVLGFTAGLALALAIGTAAVVWAQAQASKPGHTGCGGGVHRLMALDYLGKQLDLTAEQKQQIKDILRARRSDLKTVIDETFAARKTLGAAIAGGNADAIVAAEQQVSAAQLKGVQLRAQLHAKIFGEVLQSAQRSKAVQLLAEFDQRADQRRQRIDQFLDGFWIQQGPPFPSTSLGAGRAGRPSLPAVHLPPAGQEIGPGPRSLSSAKDGPGPISFPAPPAALPTTNYQLPTTNS